MTEAPQLLLVDGFNVLHAGILHGRERRQWRSPESRRRLIEAVRQFEASEPSEIWIVFDGQGKDATTETRAGQRLLVRHAPDADDFMVEQATAAASQRRVRIVSSDRRLRRRADRVGALVMSPLRFLAACGRRAGDAPPAPQQGK